MKKHSDQTGKVYFVGAGPSDPGLLTLKGLWALQHAQTVIYDALIGPGIYSLIPQDAEKIPVGKRAGRHSASQEQINDLILAQALKGRRVVRLKGGDPFLFGRGGEELELLGEHGIPYEIVPGVTSALAVPAYAGIPVTYRGIASGVHILTGHKKRNEPLDINFEALLRAGGTYVFLMGMSALHEIADGFRQAGMPPDMPAAVIAQGTGAAQHSVITTLGALEEDTGRQNLKTPAVIVIGKTAAFAERFAWRENLPLSRSRIVVTRPASRSAKLVQQLQELGAEVLQLPAIRTQIRDCGCQFREILKSIQEYQYLVFTSAAGVEYFFELLEQLELDVRCIGPVRLAVIGSATKEALKKRGLQPQLMPEYYNSTALGQLIYESASDGDRVLLLRSSMGSRELVSMIKGENQEQKNISEQKNIPDQKKKQITVTDFAIYDTIYLYGPRGFHAADAYSGADLAGTDRAYLKNLPADGGIDMVMFTSASTVRGFVQMTAGADYTKIRAVCIGQMTAAQASDYGMQVYVAEKETLESMVETAIQIQKAAACSTQI